MKSKAGHIIKTLMVLIAAAPFLIPGFLALQKVIIVHEMIEKLEVEELHELKLNKEHLKWVKPNKECLIGDRLFDVKEIREEGNFLVLKGLYDNEEKEIIEKMSSFSAPIPNEKDRSSTIFQLTHLDLECADTVDEIVLPEASRDFPGLVLIIQSVDLDNCFSPPELV